jgi:hypothetical protein
LGKVERRMRDVYIVNCGGSVSASASMIPWI